MIEPELPEAADSSSLLIRCPQCSQRFKVGEELRDRMVECGACEHRFRIVDQVIVRSKKIYPGERKGSSLSRFSRIPPAPDAAVGSSPTFFPASDPSQIDPPSPQRILAGLAGVGGMVLIALIFMFNSRPGGLLDGMSTDRRLILAGFMGLLGCAMLVYANPRNRGRALVIGLVLAGGLISLPLIFTGGSQPLDSVPPLADEDIWSFDNVNLAAPERSEADELRALIGTGPLEDEQARLRVSDDLGEAFGIWLKNLNVSNNLLARDFLIRVTGANAASHLYPRGNSNYLMVLSGVKVPLEELTLVVSALGRADRVHAEMGVIEVTVDPARFQEGPVEKLANPEDPAFYALNKRELESIDLARVERAVKRLATAEPKVYRDDITKQMLRLLGQESVDFIKPLAQALMSWSEDPGPAGEVALGVLTRLTAQKKPVPTELVQLLAKEGTKAAVPQVHRLWDENPTGWESLYGEFGTAAEPLILAEILELGVSHRQSALRLLRRVGTSKSLPILDRLDVDALGEEKVMIQQAREAITKRGEE